MRVVDKRARAPGFGRALVRTLLRLIEVDPFLLGGLPAGICVFFTKYKQRLGDMVAGAYVLGSTTYAEVRAAQMAAEAVGEFWVRCQATRSRR